MDGERGANNLGTGWRGWNRIERASPLTNIALQGTWRAQGEGHKPSPIGRREPSFLKRFSTIAGLLSDIPGVRIKMSRVSTMKFTHTHATATFRTPWSVTSWHTICLIGTALWHDDESFDPRNPDADFTSVRQIMIGPLAPEGTPPRVVRVIARLDNESKQIEWTIEVNRAPAIDAPEEIKSLSEKLGGADGLFESLHAVWEQTPIARLRARYLLSAATGTIALVPRHQNIVNLPDKVTQLGDKAHIEAVGIRFESGVAGLQEIAVTYLHDDAEYIVNVVAMVPLQVGNRDELFPALSQFGELLYERLVTATPAGGA